MTRYLAILLIEQRGSAGGEFHTFATERLSLLQPSSYCGCQSLLPEAKLTCSFNKKEEQYLASLQVHNLS